MRDAVAGRSVESAVESGPRSQPNATAPRWASPLLLAVVALSIGSTARAADELIAGRRALVAGKGIIAVQARPGSAASIALPSGADDPTQTGATLRFFDTALPGGGSATMVLPKEGWQALGSPPGASGYRYLGRKAVPADDTCRVVSLRSHQLKILCKNAALPLRPPLSGSLGVVLEIGTGSRYCASFGGDERRNDSARLRRDNAPAPGACPTIVASRPNFIVVNLDDARADGVDQMPVLATRVQAEGLTFSNAYTPFPSCCSSRASLLTGNYARTHGVLGVAGLLGGADRFRETGSENQTIAVWLRNAGYRTGLFGKYLNSYSQVTEGFCNINFHIPPGWTRWRAMLSPEQYGGLNGSPATFVDENRRCTSYERGGCSDTGVACCVDSQCGATATCTNPRPDSRLHNSCTNYTTDLTAEQARDFISESVAEGRNFFAYWTPYAPHGGSPGISPIPSAEFVGAFNSLPPFRPPNYNVVTALQPRWVRFARPDPFLGALTDSIRRRAYETLLSVDKQLGLLLDHLQALGVDEDTVIILTSDNGVGWGEHRWIAQFKGCPFDMCQRVPFMIRYRRGILDAPATRDAVVLNIDIAPTIASLAGISVPVATEGVDAAGWIVGPTPPSWRRDYLMELRRAGPTGARDDRIHYSGNPSDGDQIRVLFGDPLASEPRASLLFEFDGGDGVVPGTIVVPIGANATATFDNLGNAVEANVPFSSYTHVPSATVLYLNDLTPEHHGLLWWEEVNTAGAIDYENGMPDYFGVRDVVGGFSWVEYETGERELYDLVADPYEMNNLADDPGYAAVRASLEIRLDELLAP